jgi:hypothetical protein
VAMIQALGCMEAALLKKMFIHCTIYTQNMQGNFLNKTGKIQGIPCSCIHVKLPGTLTF